MKPPLLVLFCALAATAATGCWLRKPAGPQAPQFAAPPTLETLVDRVNATGRIHQLQAESATISMQGTMGSLQANLAVERPNRLRLQGKFMGVLGGVDIGSNDEVFWMWTSLARPPAVYYARHDDFRRSRMADMLPLRPEWLIEALGVVQIDPSRPIKGPYSRGAGRLELQTQLDGINGEMTRIIVLDATYGWILEQYLYNPHGELVAQVTASEHRYYADVDVSLPHHVEIHLPKPEPGATIRIDVGGYAINQLYGDPAQRWRMPQIEGVPAVNVTEPGNLPLGGAGPLGNPTGGNVPTGDAYGYGAAPNHGGAPNYAGPPNYAPPPGYGGAPNLGGTPNYGAAPTAERPRYRGFPGR